MAKLSKISVEAHDYNNNAFTCECTLDGAETHERKITEDELLQHLDADRQGRIPQVDNAGEIDERHYHVSLQQWLDEAGIIGLEATLERIINVREGRTGTGRQALPKVAAVGDINDPRILSLLETIAA